MRPRMSWSKSTRPAGSSTAVSLPRAVDRGGVLAAVVGVAGFAELLAGGIVGALGEHAAEAVVGPGDARAGGVAALGDLAGGVEELPDDAGVGGVDAEQAARAVVGVAARMAGGIDVRAQAARGVVLVAVRDAAVGEDRRLGDHVAEAVELAALGGGAVGRRGVDIFVVEFILREWAVAGQGVEAVGVARGGDAAERVAPGLGAGRAWQRDEGPGRERGDGEQHTLGLFGDSAGGVVKQALGEHGGRAGIVRRDAGLRAAEAVELRDLDVDFVLAADATPLGEDRRALGAAVHEIAVADRRALGAVAGLDLGGEAAEAVVEGLRGGAVRRGDGDAGGRARGPRWLW
jgi:hypothetical protein